MARTPDTGEDRREQILDAAMRVFAQKGFSKATNRDVAQEAGITTGLIYYYFENKEALLNAALAERSPFQIMAQVPPEMLEQPPTIFLPMFLQRVLAIVEDEQFVNILRMILPEVLHNPEVSSIAFGFFQRILDFLSQYLQIQVARGTVRADVNSELVTQLLVSNLMGLVMRRQVIRDPSVRDYTHAEIVQAVVGTFLQGIQKS
jgi:AcrR family transcriptional regulator